MKCPKCKGEMEEGVIFDRGHLNVLSTQKFGTGIKGMLFRKIENEKNILSYRCKSCGYLESYAK